MVALCICRHCGSPTDRPTFFTFTNQQIFNFIWDHPRCTMNDLHIGLYGSIRANNNITTQICKIRKQLLGTGYSLITHWHRPMATYEIINHNTTPRQPSTGAQHVPT